jgi:hypothetical protein
MRYGEATAEHLLAQASVRDIEALRWTEVLLDSIDWKYRYMSHTLMLSVLLSTQVPKYHLFLPEYLGTLEFPHHVSQLG